MCLGCQGDPNLKNVVKWKRLLRRNGYIPMRDENSYRLTAIHPFTGEKFVVDDASRIEATKDVLDEILVRR